MNDGEKELLKQIRIKLKEKFAKAKSDPVGFQCWDCDKVIEGLDLKSEYFKSSPISLEGYIQTFCSECMNNEDY